MSLILITTLFYQGIAIRRRNLMLITLRRGFKRLNEKKKRDPEQHFSSLRRWLSGWKNSEVILSHATNQLFVFVLVFLLMLSSAFILFIIILICMHARFFFKKDQSSILPSIHSSSIHYTTYLPFHLIYKLDMSKMRLWQGMQRIDLLSVIFSHPK